LYLYFIWGSVFDTLLNRSTFLAWLRSRKTPAPLEDRRQCGGAQNQRHELVHASYQAPIGSASGDRSGGCFSGGTPNNAYGYGVLDAYAAVQAALETR
jgi:hypothetical protein